MITNKQVMTLSNRIYGLNFHALVHLYEVVYGTEALKELIDEDEGEDLKQTHADLRDILSDPYEIANITPEAYENLNNLITTLEGGTN